MQGFTFQALGLTVTESPGLARFRAMATTLMAQHNLDGWEFQLDQARRRAGHCRFPWQGKPGVLSFSAPLMEIWTEDQQRQIVLHEIAHALAGPGHGHDTTWALACLRIGARPERCWGEDGEESPPSRWTGTCPLGHEVPRERKPSKDISCARCSPRFDSRYLFTWQRNY